MKAVIFRRFGGPEVLEYADIAEPALKPGQVLVRVKACSVNHLDIWIRQGIPAYKINLPHISGCDVSGVIEQAGLGVSRWRVGDKVVLAPGISCGGCQSCHAGLDNRCIAYGIRGAATDGGYAELTVADEQDVLALPPGISFEQAAAYPLVFLTAWHMLVTRAGLKAGESVLVHAAGSGIGHAAIQIASYLKATVYATAGSDEKAEKAKSLGVKAVINYRKASFEEEIRKLTDGRGVDVVFEHIGPDTWEGSLKALAKGGRLVTCGATSGPVTLLDLRYLFSRELSILGAMMGTRAELAQVTDLIGQKKLTPLVDAVFPLPRAQQAQERMLSRQVFGKLILAP